MSRKKLVVAGDKSRLADYGFFYHKPSSCWWYVFGMNTKKNANVELSLRVYDDTDEVTLHATNDHMRLPSVYDRKYNAKNYLELEEELDKFSFDEWTGIGIIFEMIVDGVLDYIKPTHSVKQRKKYNIIIDAQDHKNYIHKTLDTKDE